MTFLVEFLFSCFLLFFLIAFLVESVFSWFLTFLFSFINSHLSINAVKINKISLGLSLNRIYFCIGRYWFLNTGNSFISFEVFVCSVSWKQDSWILIHWITESILNQTLFVVYLPYHLNGQSVGRSVGSSAMIFWKGLEFKLQWRICLGTICISGMYVFFMDLFTIWI